MTLRPRVHTQRACDQIPASSSRHARSLPTRAITARLGDRSIRVHALRLGHVHAGAARVHPLVARLGARRSLDALDALDVALGARADANNASGDANGGERHGVHGGRRRETREM